MKNISISPFMVTLLLSTSANAFTAKSYLDIENLNSSESSAALNAYHQGLSEAFSIVYILNNKIPGGGKMDACPPTVEALSAKTMEAAIEITIGTAANRKKVPKYLEKVPVSSHALYGLVTMFPCAK